MKVQQLIPLGLLLLGSFTGCIKDDDNVPDPDGTVTYSFNYTVQSSHVTFYQGRDEHMTTEQRYATILFRILDASMNFSFTSILSLDPNGIQWLVITNGMGGEMVDVGAVSGLGAVTGIPASGWTASQAVQVGHGYVCRFRHAYEYPAATELPYHYARVYVEELIVGVNGGVIGAKVKYQVPFN